MARESSPRDCATQQDPLGAPAILDLAARRLDRRAPARETRAELRK